MSAIHLLEIQNPYPDWVSIHLNGVFDPSDKTFSLSLILSCQEQWRSLLAGRVKLGLKAVIFNLTFSSGEFLAISEERQEITPLTNTNASKFSWQLFPAVGEKRFNQINQEISLGKVTLKDEPCYLTGTLDIIPANLSITDAEGLWRHDLSPNKHGILERALAHFFVKHYFTPQISAVHYAIADSIPPFDADLTGTSEPNSVELNNLQNILDQIYQSPSENLVDLAKIAGLNLKTDLSGGNFVGAVLNGVELSGANLSRVNFRGAILTDADLSEANLKEANFSGADLSGAYLESADLQNADFHKASLALVNLIGANLSHANLSQTTITNANLSGAIVTNALFHNNPGMTDALKESLQKRGAKFLSNLD